MSKLVDSPKPVSQKPKIVLRYDLYHEQSYYAIVGTSDLMALQRFGSIKEAMQFLSQYWEVKQRYGS